MRPEHLEALRDAVVEALEAGLDHGGASIDDYRDGRGERGEMQNEFLVHTREGEPCPRQMAATIVRIVVGGRSTYYCPAARCACANAAPSQVTERDFASRARPLAVRAAAKWSVPGTTVKTEAIVLRSIRYGEADRILHLYSSARGRMNAIAKGARKPKSRFGGRLEPFFRLDLVLHEGRSELLTVTGVSTVDGYPRLRSSGPSLNAAARGCDAVLRLFDSVETNRPAYNLLCRYLSMLDAADAGRAAGVETALAFRLKLALAAGFSPELASCARCGEVDHLTGFSGAAGGVVCSACEAGSFPLSEEAHGFMVEALAKPLTEAPQSEPPELRQVERAVGETLEHHAHVQLRSAA